MSGLQATWMPQHTLFLWSTTDRLSEALRRDLPAVGDASEAVVRFLAMPGSKGVVRKKIHGVELDLRQAIPGFTAVDAGARLSDSLRCWVNAAKFALELAARRRVYPEVDGTVARWRALLTRKPDQARFEALVGGLPPASRCLPVREKGRGAIELLPAERVVRDFLDAVVDDLYRRGAHPGPARGWPLELAEALRSPGVAFRPRDARHHAIPMLLRTWSRESDVVRLRLGLRLRLPERGDDRFRLQLGAHPIASPDAWVPVDEVWDAGAELTVGERRYEHPAHAAVRGLARASRLFDPLRECLKGDRPCDLLWDADQTWRFLDEGLPALRDAGFDVSIPPEFEGAGPRRIRARIRLSSPTGRRAGRVDLAGLLRFRWEVTLGDRVLTGDEFTRLVGLGKPIVRWDGDWVLLSPGELARLPKGLDETGEMPAATALKAALVGEHEGVPVVADAQLAEVLRALRDPPAAPRPMGLKGDLRPYQARGYAWLSTLGQLGLGACLADDMGLGKTIQLIAHVLRRRQFQRGTPSLVVCPTSVLGNWERELKRFAPRMVVMRYHGTSRDLRAIGAADVVLTTYGLMVRDGEALAKQKFDVVCLDEAQSIKNPDSQRARAARQLRANHRVALSGTPIENRLDELWSLMEFLNPGLLGPRATFRRTVAVPVERFGDEEVARRLRVGIAPFLMRRLKTDPAIIDDLPDKIERIEYTPLTREQAVLYEQVVETAMDSIREASEIERRGRVLAMLTALKQVCNHPAHYLKDEHAQLAGRSGKLERLTDLLENLFDLGERALIFTQYREMGSLIQRHVVELFGYDVPFLHGATPTRRRDEIVARFQNAPDAAPVLVVSLRAGGTGLNLTRATHVVHYDRWWNPAVEDQATDRAYRIGQDRNVQVHKLVCQDTLEERIDNLLEEKRQLAEQVVGSGERWVTELDDETLRQLVALGADAVGEDD